jgi:Kef-type K+ transport system membrane component KefB
MSVWILVLLTIQFLAALWGIGFIFKLLLLPPIVGEIIIGIIEGPNVLDIVPFSDEDEGESLFSIFGTIGISLLLMHSGLHINQSKILTIGYRALIIGVLGTLFPIILGLFAFRLFGFNWHSSFASALIITPASVGVAMRALISERKLHTTYGQAILIAANLDDLISIMLFVILKNTTSDVTFVNVGAPIIGAIMFVVIMAITGNYLAPILSKTLRNMDKEGMTTRDTIHLMTMSVMFTGLGTIGHYIGSNLLGSFLAGYFFTKVKRSSVLWNTHIKPYMSWLLRLFFAASIAFKIPISNMMTVTAFWKGVIVAVVCIISKLMATMHMGKLRWVIGWGLVSRGEFSFLISEFVLDEQIITNEQYAFIIWGIVLSTLCAPIVLNYLIRKMNPQVIKKSDAYRITIEGVHHNTMSNEITNIIYANGLEIGEGDMYLDNNDKTDVEHYVVYNKSGDIDEEMREEIKCEIQNIDDGIQVCFDKVELVHNGRLRINMMFEDEDCNIEDNIIDLLNSMNIEHEIDSIRSDSNPINSTIISTCMVTEDELDKIELSDVVTKCHCNSSSAQIACELVDKEYHKYKVVADISSSDVSEDDNMMNRVSIV